MKPTRRSTVPSFPTLSIPAPEVGLLTKSSSTSITDGFGVANTSVKGLSITLPSVSIPTALALPGAADLPALDGITQVAGLLTSAPVKIDLATLAASLVDEADRDRTRAGAVSARNRMTGIVTRVVSDPVMSQVEMVCGPYRIVSLMSTEAATELGLEVGVRAIASVKSTNVVVELP